MSPNETEPWVNDFFSVQAFRYVAGKFFTDLGAKPESFWDLKFRWYLPAVYSVLQNTQHLIDWDAYLRKFASIQRKGWKKPNRRIHELKYDDPFETDLDHLISWSCLVAHVYDPNKRWLTDENRLLRTRAILMFLLHETDELISGDKTPDEKDYAEVKEAAISPAKILLRDTYKADDMLIRIWDEFNKKETPLSRDIDFLDHEAAVHKWNLYDWEFPGAKSPALAREFSDYYEWKHSDHPDVALLKSHSAEQMIRLMPFLHATQPVRFIQMARDMWQDTRQFWDTLEKHQPWLVIQLSSRILERVSCLLPT